MCGVGLWSLQFEHVKRYRTLFIFAGLMLGAVTLYLILVPFPIWTLLPGHGLIEQIDSAAGIKDAHRTIAINPVAGFDTLLWFFTPAAVLILGAQLNSKERDLLLPIIIGLVVLSGFIGLAQSLGSSSGSLYFYQVTNHGSPVGLFANRNHQAITLAMAFPMLIVFAQRSVGQSNNVRRWIAFSIGLFVVPLLLVTGSRAGVFAGIFGVAAAAVIYRRPKSEATKNRTFSTQSWQTIFVFVIILGLGAVTNLFSRAAAIDRIFNDSEQESRLAFWKPVAAMAQHYMPTGTGPGGFADSYRTIEPLSLLDFTYLNRAHNDWLEIFTEFGLIGATLMFAVVSWVTALGIKAFIDHRKGQSDLYACLGFVIIVILCIGSITDYPLRTPSIAAVAVLAAIWLSSRAPPQKYVS